MEKVFVISEDNSVYNDSDSYLDKKVVRVLFGSTKFKIEDLGIEFKSKSKVIWEAMSDKERGKTSLISYMNNLSNFVTWLKEQKGFTEAEEFEEIDWEQY